MVMVRVTGSPVCGFNGEASVRIVDTDAPTYYRPPLIGNRKDFDRVNFDLCNEGLASATRADCQGTKA